MERHWKNFCPRAGETFEQEHRQEIKTIIAGTAVMVNRRELAADRRELRHDFRRRAGPAEIARDRAAIAVSAEKSSRNRRDWRYDRWAATTVVGTDTGTVVSTGVRSCSIERTKRSV